MKEKFEKIIMFLIIFILEFTAVMFLGVLRELDLKIGLIFNLPLCILSAFACIKIIYSEDM